MSNSFWNLAAREVQGHAMTSLDSRLSVSRRIGSDSLKRNADARLELIRRDALPELTSKPEITLRGRDPSQGTIEL